MDQVLKSNQYSVVCKALLSDQASHAYAHIQALAFQMIASKEPKLCKVEAP
jgi:hypothetical protein